MLSKLRSLFGGKPSPAPASPRDHFADEALTVASSLPHVTAAKRIDGEFGLDVTTAAGGTVRINLDNVFDDTRDVSPDERRNRLLFFFGSLAEKAQPDDWDEAHHLFVPVIRGVTYGIEMTMKEPDAAFARAPFLPLVDLLVAIDRPTSMAFVTRKNVERWKVDDATLFAAALARAPAFDPSCIELYDSTHGPLFIVTSNDTYETTRLVTPGWLASFRGKVEGNPIAIIPERATLMVGGDARPEMIERLIGKAANDFGTSGRRISPALYTVDDAGKVVPFVLEVNDPLASAVKIAHEKLAIYEHGTQKETLDAHYEQTGHDVFVASYKVFESPEAGVRSMCTWTEGAHSYLPKTDRIVLVVLGEEDGKAKMVADVPFEALVDRLTLVPGLLPARYETTGEFPSGAEIDALKKRYETGRANS